MATQTQPLPFNQSDPDQMTTSSTDLDAQPVSAPAAVAEILEEENLKFLYSLAPTLIFVLLMMAMGLVGNTAVFAIYYTRYSPSPTRTYILAMSVCDLLANALSLPADVVEMRYHYTFVYGWGCKAIRTVKSFLGFLSAAILVAVAIDRYRCVCRRRPQQPSFRQVRVVFILCAFSMSVTLPYTVLTGSQTTPLDSDRHHHYVNHTEGVSNITGIQCSIQDVYLRSLFFVLYNAFTGLVFVVSVSIVTVSYTRIAYTLWQHKRKVRTVTAGAVELTGFGTGNRRLAGGPGGGCRGGEGCQTDSQKDVSLTADSPGGGGEGEGCQTDSQKDASLTAGRPSEGEENCQTNCQKDASLTAGGPGGGGGGEGCQTDSQKDASLTAGGPGRGCGGGERWQTNCQKDASLTAGGPGGGGGGEGCQTSSHKDASLTASQPCEGEEECQTNSQKDASLTVSRPGEGGEGCQTNSQKDTSLTSSQPGSRKRGEDCQTNSQKETPFTDERKPPEPVSESSGSHSSTKKAHAYTHDRQKTGERKNSQPTRSQSSSVKEIPASTTLMLFVLTAVFILNYLPYFLVIVLRVVLGEGVFVARLGPNGYHIALRSYFLNSVVNPFVYGFCSGRFRLEFLRFFGCKK